MVAKFFILVILNFNYDGALGRNICILAGPPGQGKSVLANVYAYTHAEKYSLIFWIDSETEASETASYHELAALLKVPTQIDKIPIRLLDLKSKIYAALEEYKADKQGEKPFLLILDNVEALPNYSPKKGHLLVTSQKKLGTASIAVPAFTLSEALLLLESTTGQTCSLKMQQQLIDQQLYFSPLLIRMAAYYIASTPGMTLESYSSSLDKTKSAFDHDPDYKKSLKAAYAITKQRLEKEEPLSIEVLKQISLLAPDHIPIDLIDRYLELNNPEYSRRIYQRDKVLNALEQYSLLKWDKMSGTFSLHRQTQQVIRLEGAQASTMIRIINDYPSVAQYNPMTHGTTEPFRKILPHCASLIQAPITDTACRAQLGLTLTRYYIESASAFSEAETYLQEIQKAIPNKAIQGRVHFYKGMIHLKLKQYALAQQELQDAQINFEQDLDECHYKRIEQLQIKCNRDYQIAIAQSYLAQALKNQKTQLSRAYTLLEQSKRVMMSQQGKDHFDVGRILREQAEIRLFEHNYSEARSLIKKSLDSQKRCYGKKFMFKPPVAATFTVQGDIHQQEGKDLQAAIDAYAQALQVNQNIYGNNHRYVAISYQKLAKAYRPIDTAMADHMESQAQEIYDKLKRAGEQ